MFFINGKSHIKNIIMLKPAYFFAVESHLYGIFLHITLRF